MIATSFSESWNEGARRYYEAAKAGTAKVVPIKDAWAQYVPVTLAAANFTVSVPSQEKVVPLIDRERRILVTKHLERLIVPYRTLLQADPGNDTAHLQVAIIYAQNGLYDQALKEFDSLLARNPRSSDAHNNKGNVYYTLGEYERAAEAYLYAEQLDPTDGGVKMNTALAHYQRGKVREALEKYREAVALNKDLSAQYKAFERLLIN